MPKKSVRQRRAELFRATGKIREIIDRFEAELSKENLQGLIALTEPAKDTGYLGGVVDLKNAGFLIKLQIQLIADKIGVEGSILATEIAAYLAAVDMGLIEEGSELTPNHAQAIAKGAKCAAFYLLHRYAESNSDGNCPSGKSGARQEGGEK